MLQSRIQELMAKLAMEKGSEQPDPSGISLWEAEIVALQALSDRRLTFNREDFEGEGMDNFRDEMESDAIGLIKILQAMKIQNLTQAQKQKIQADFLLMLEILHIKTGLIL